MSHRIVIELLEGSCGAQILFANDILYALHEFGSILVVNHASFCGVGRKMLLDEG